MAKAALDAIHGLNLFGEEGSSLSIIHVDPDAQYRNHVILSTLLPRESNSKETDAALLCVIGFPGFSIENPDLKKSTEERVTECLECEFGFKRFAKDGHHNVKEDRNKKYYDPLELEVSFCQSLYVHIEAAHTPLVNDGTDRPTICIGYILYIILYVLLCIFLGI